MNDEGRSWIGELDIQRKILVFLILLGLKLLKPNDNKETSWLSISLISR